MSTLDDPRHASLPYEYDREEMLADFHLACVARAIDQRELTLQKQNKVFFEISGAGHEALGLGFARALRPGYDWFFPYYRDRALCLGLGALFFGACFACKYLGDTEYLSPALAAWLPVIAFGPLAVVLFDAIHT